VRLYIEVAKRSFQRQMAYRAANLAGLATNTFFGLMRTYLFLGLYAGRDVEAGWTVGDAVAFVWLSQALIMPVFLWGWYEIALTIRSGDVVSDLSKPFDYYSFWLSQDAGRAVFHLIFRAVPTLLAGVVLFDVGFPADLGRWLAFLLSVTLAIWISFGLRFLVNVSAFWLLDYRGLGIALMFTTSFFSGMLVPLVFWPDWAQTIVVWLPFAGIIQAPVDVWLGKATGMALLDVLFYQISWALGLMVAGRLTMTMAVRKVVVQGG
jgi:ABC-2 type transport system permease protein